MYLEMTECLNGLLNPVVWVTQGVDGQCDVMLVVESQQVGIDVGKCPYGTPQECAVAVGHTSGVSLYQRHLKHLASLRWNCGSICEVVHL